MALGAKRVGEDSDASFPITALHGYGQVLGLVSAGVHQVARSGGWAGSRHEEAGGVGQPRLALLSCVSGVQVVSASPLHLQRTDLNKSTKRQMNKALINVRHGLT